MTNGAIPNLFLAGAPKCGTTSMYEYLRHHPQVFFPARETGDNYWRVKEPNHLCQDMQIEDGHAVLNRADYLALYQDQDAVRRRGDASPFNLCSVEAPRSIRELSPDPRIVIMLRPPLDMMRSYHIDLIRSGLEDVTDFHEAIQLVRTRPVKGYRNYLQMARFGSQVERYFDIFGKRIVKVVLLEDMIRAPRQTIREVFEFLDIDPEYRPDLRVHHETPRNGPFERFLTTAYRYSRISPVAQRIFPYTTRRKFLKFIRRHEPDRKAPDPRDEDLRREFSPEVDRLAELIDRDLQHWKKARTA